MKRKIYFGGNFEFQYKDYSKEKLENDYRAIILGDADKMLHTPTNETKTVEIRPGVEYVGPFYFYEEGTTANNIVRNEYQMVMASSDVIFLLDNVNSPGTISELIHAAYNNKNIYIFYIEMKHDDGEPENDVDSLQWYPITMSQIISNKVRLYKCRDKNDAVVNIQELIKNEF